jgi:hypothetical protein
MSVEKANELILMLDKTDILDTRECLNEMANLFSLCGIVVSKKGLTIKQEDDSFDGRERDIVTANVSDSLIRIHSRILQSKFEKVVNAAFLDLKKIHMHHFSYVMLHEFGHIIWRLKARKKHPVYLKLRKCFRSPRYKTIFWDHLEIENKTWEEQEKIREDFANLFAEKFIEYAKNLSSLESYKLPEETVERMLEESKTNNY